MDWFKNFTRTPAGKRIEWWLIFLACFAPLANLIWLTWTLQLGADPAKTITTTTGEWALRFLWITLAVTPLRHWFKWHKLQRYRRMLGLYAAFYAGVHFLAFLSVILGWRFDLLAQELIERPYIVVGFIALILLLPLVVTSTKAMQRKLGKRWLTLHKLVYPIGILAFIHLFWLVRASYIDAAIYGALLALLLGFRLKRRYWP